MPRTRSLETYPNRQFLALVTKVLTQNAPVLVPCTPGQAASMRGELHAWRRAAEATPQQAAAYGIEVMKLRDIAFRIVKEPTSGLECIPQTQLVTPGLIEAALGGTAERVDPAKQALENLMRGLGKESGNGG